MQQTDPTMFCLLSLLAFVLIGISFQEIDWSTYHYSQQENRKSKMLKKIIKLIPVAIAIAILLWAFYCLMSFAAYASLVVPN